MKEVVKNVTEKGIPLETIYADIDYMNRYMDFTLGDVCYLNTIMRYFRKKFKKLRAFEVKLVSHFKRVQRAVLEMDWLWRLR